MAFGDGRRSLFLLLLLLLGVLKRGNTQIICRIEVDSERGWWRDLNATAEPTSDATTFCDGFLYRETNLKCPTSGCPSRGSVDDACTVYYNVDSKGPCLATCNKNCKHGYTCSSASANCPCQKSQERYDKKRMCVALARLKKCANGELNENNKCIPTSCIDACPNGRCSEDGKCICPVGFTRDTTSGKCVPSECLDGCVYGTCDLSGECVCQDGFEKDGGEAYKCTKIIHNEDRGHSPGRDLCEGIECVNGQCLEGKCKCNAGYQENQDGGQCSLISGTSREEKQLIHQPGCDRSGCTEANEHCVQGQCQCIDGFRNDPTNKNKCVKIECPEYDPTNYCLRLCRSRGCTRPSGLCDTLGECKCEDGYAKNKDKKYTCEPIVCPLRQTRNNPVTNYCERVCRDSRCPDNNGWCDTAGECKCVVGFRKDPVDKYRCNKVTCPDSEHKDHCQKECQKSGCNITNGRCAQGQCRCTNGFKQSSSPFACEQITCPDGSHAAYCKKVCKDSCKNGGCSDEGDCFCYQGYQKHLTGKYVCNLIDCQTVWDHDICKARCNTHCTNGACDASGTCKCSDGFKKGGNGLYQCNKISCPSSDRDDYAYCKAQCETSCDHGKCENNGYCACNVGFKKSSGAYECVAITCPDAWQASYCKAECEKGCTNGRCSDYGVCQCNAGYKLDRNDKYVCNKINCRSNEGDDDAYCKAHCDAYCKSGVCDGKGGCSCSYGFKKAPNTLYQCEKIDCASEGQVYRGYCEDQCTRFCHNGACVDGIRCECKIGFKKGQGKTYECKKIHCPSSESEDNAYCKTQCEGGCQNGMCNYRGVCNCTEGFRQSPHDNYQCDVINCPSEGKDDKNYCASQCSKYCNNGTCDNGGECVCNDGFKKKPLRPHQCNQISCPSSEPEDVGFCSAQCKNSCEKGKCDAKGDCTCNNGFTKIPKELYMCAEITCPSREGENVTERAFCKSVCEQHCTKGVCDDLGHCICNAGFKKIPDEDYNCIRINCPTSKSEDKAYCKSQCSQSCTNGVCKYIGACECNNSLEQCEKQCSSNQDCRPEDQQYPQNGNCATDDVSHAECLEQCITECKQDCENESCSCEEGSVNVKPCLKFCLKTKKEKFRNPQKAHGVEWATIAVAVFASLVFSAVVFGVVFWARRFLKTREGRYTIAMTERLTGDALQDADRKAARECESYLEPRQVAQAVAEDSSQYPYYETVQEVVPAVVGPVNSPDPRDHSYLQMADLSVAPADVALYLNVHTSQRDDDKAYENIFGK